jgi:hypothetical protein
MNDAATASFAIYPNASTFPGGVIPPPSVPTWINTPQQQQQQSPIPNVAGQVWPYGNSNLYGMGVPAPQMMMMSPQQQQQQQQQQQMAAAAYYYNQRAHIPPVLAWTTSWWLVPCLLLIIIFLLLWHLNPAFLRSGAPPVSSPAGAGAGAGIAASTIPTGANVPLASASFSGAALDAASQMASSFQDGVSGGGGDKSRSSEHEAGPRSIVKIFGVSTILALTGCVGYLIYRHFRSRSVTLLSGNSNGGVGGAAGQSVLVPVQ